MEAQERPTEQVVDEFKKNFEPRLSLLGDELQKAVN